MHKDKTSRFANRRKPVATMIFVNLPVSDLPRSVAFYEAVGATRNPQFSDDTAACMVFSDTIHVMLLTHAKFAGFTRTRSPTRTRAAKSCSASPPTAARTWIA
jgi:predicted lactoylglutathione lyase